MGFYIIVTIVDCCTLLPAAANLDAAGGEWGLLPCIHNKRHAGIRAGWFQSALLRGAVIDAACMLHAACPGMDAGAAGPINLPTEGGSVS